jgi:hypothetical protein
MKISLKKYIIIASALIFCVVGLSFAETINIKDAIENGVKLDGKKIAVEGETIGHVMKRGEFAWLNINDKTECIGVWAGYAELAKIRHLGKYAVTGDWIRVYGVFNKSCPAHGGDTDIHAVSVVVVTRGSARNFAHDQRKVNILIFLIGVLVCLYIIKILKRRR